MYTKSTKKSKSNLYLGGIFLTLILSILCGNIQIENQDSNILNSVQNRVIIPPSFAGNHAPIIIDPMEIGFNWTDCDIVTGNGTLLYPFTIEDIFIDADFVNNCISIRNSMYFACIRNCTLINAAMEYQAGIWMSNCSNINVSLNCMEDNFWGVYSTSANNITVAANQLYNLRDIGIYFDGDNMTIIDNYILNSFRDGSAIRMGGSRETEEEKSKIIIMNNTCINHNTGLQLYEDSTDLPINISYNVFENNYEALSIPKCGKHRIFNNTFVNNLWHGIHIYGTANGCQIYNNFFSGNGLQYSWSEYPAITISADAINTNIFNNSFVHNALGIYIIDAFKVNITQNLFSSNVVGDIRNDNGLQILIFDNIFNEKPSISTLSDVTYFIEQTNKNLTWTITDPNIAQATYHIFQDGENLTSRTWESSIPIHINLDLLPLGKYNFTLIVSDGLYGISSDEVWVTIVKIYPVAMIVANVTTLLERLWIQFNASISLGDPPYSYLWEFGDGSVNSTELAPLHRYTEQGEYIANLTVWDINGHAYTDSIRINVQHSSFTVFFFANATLIQTGQSIQFTDETRYGAEPYQYQWDFGDGSPISTIQNPVHQYNNSGEFSVILTVYDWRGDFGTHNTRIVVYSISTSPTNPFASIPGYPYEIPLVLLGIGFMVLDILIKRKKMRMMGATGKVFVPHGLD